MGVRDAADIFDHCISSGDGVESGSNGEGFVTSSFRWGVLVNEMNIIFLRRPAVVDRRYT